jgi:ABC-type multidrug transport system fused ATPase/permease subunit
LTPSIAFTALAVFNELKYALSILPETFVEGLQALVSLRRIEAYLSTPEVDSKVDEILTSLPAAKIAADIDGSIALRNATVTWPTSGHSKTPSGYTTPGSSRFILHDISLDFPIDGLSLISGPLGSGKVRPRLFHLP